MTRAKQASVTAIIAIAWLLSAADPAMATPATCTTGIARAARVYVEGRSGVLAGCRDRALRSGDAAAAAACGSDAASLAAMATLASTMDSAINLACGGPDAVCGNGDDATLGSIGWDMVSCPDLGGAGCDMTIDHCGAIASCLRCTADAATTRVADTAGGQLVPGGDLQTVRCQRAIVAASNTYLRAASRTLQSCWKKVAAGTMNGPCPEAAVSGPVATKLAKVATKLAKKVCKRCGGADRGSYGGESHDDHRDR